MEGQPENSHKKTIQAVVVLIILVGAVYLLSHTYINKNDNGTNKVGAVMIEVQNTIAVEGVLKVPSGFPQDIPFESGQITESSVTRRHHDNMRQLSLTYKSKESMDKKYTEYLNYMKQALYQVVEDNIDSTKKSIKGTKLNASLHVTVSSNASAETLVDISYMDPLVE